MSNRILTQLRRVWRLAPTVRKHLLTMRRGSRFGRDQHDWSWLTATELLSSDHGDSLLTYFNQHKEGRGIWKCNHYFEIYERHFGRFRDQEVHILEVGVYSGGSLEMWQKYFGPRCKVYGVDIEPSCKAYESESVRIFIGDQADRNFWRHLKRQVPVLDIVIDDGCHWPEYQIITLEELLPHLRPGGVYLCEDVVDPSNEFSSYVHGLSRHLNTFDLEENFDDNERRQVCKASPLQSAVGSIHLYPFVTLIERTRAPVLELIGSKHGTQWQPFLK